MPSLNKKFDDSVDYFAVLGLHFGACDKTVKMMYRKMARRYHPDVSTIHDAQKKFQEIAFAYEVLKKYRDAYCSAFELQATRKKASANNQNPFKQQTTSEPSHNQSSTDNYAYTRRAYRKQIPIDGKDRVITYPLTLRYAIRLLRLGSFYIPGLKVKMKFTREAFEGKTFRLEGKGYNGLFGGKAGDYLVRFNIKVDSTKFQLQSGDIHGIFSVPKPLLRPDKKLELESPSGRLEVLLPSDYSIDKYLQEPFKITGMGLPADEVTPAGDFYLKLRAS